MFKVSASLLAFLLLTTFVACQSVEDDGKNKKDKTEQKDKSGVPEAVSINFRKQYPGENDPDWKTDRNGNWEAKFKKDGIHYKADYAPNGNWIETENSIKKKDLPEAVEDAIKAQFDKDDIVEIERVDHPVKGIFYDVEFKDKGKKFDIEFAEDGRIIGRE